MILDIIQTAGIIVSLILSIVAAVISNNSNQIHNTLVINESHRQLWQEGLGSGEISRVLLESVDLKTEPITDYEFRFVSLVLLHSSISFKANTSKSCVTIEEMDKDIKNFLAKPIPRAVWDKVNIYHNKKFVEYVRKLLEK